LSLLSIVNPHLDSLPVEEENIAFEKKPSTLCQFCQEIVNSFNSQDCSNLPHCESLPTLTALSENGCGLCAQMVFAINQFPFFILDDQARPSLKGRIYFSRPRRGLGRGWELRTAHPTKIDSMVKVRPALTPRKCYISNWCVSTSRTKLIPISLAIWIWG
jgi:hypothetical protein